MKIIANLHFEIQEKDQRWKIRFRVKNGDFFFLEAIFTVYSWVRDVSIL